MDQGRSHPLGGPHPPARRVYAGMRRPVGGRVRSRRRPSDWRAARPQHSMGGKGRYCSDVSRGGQGWGRPDTGQPPPQTAHDHASADATWRPRGAGTDGSARGLTASAGPIFGGGPGQRSASTAERPGPMASPSRRWHATGQSRWWRRADQTYGPGQIARSPSGECTSPHRTVGHGPEGFPRCGIGWGNRRARGSSRPSARPTSRTPLTAFAPSVVPTKP